MTKAEARPRARARSRPVDGEGRRGVRVKDAHGGNAHHGKDYKEGTVRLSAGLAETVAGMLISAVVGGPRHQEKVRGSARFTREYERFAAMEHPPEVRAWVERHFQSGGAGLAAVESQMEIYVDELSAWMDNALRYHKGHWCEPFCGCVENPLNCRP